MKHLRYAFSAIAAVGFLASGFAAMAQEKSEISISRQPGILYMPTHIIEKQKLIEKHAARLGVANVTTKWITFSSGGAQTDALLAGGVDMLNTGTGNLSATVGPHQRRREGHRCDLGAADAADIA